MKYTQPAVCQTWMEAVVVARSVSTHPRLINQRACCLKIDEPVSRIHQEHFIASIFFCVDLQHSLLTVCSPKTDDPVCSLRHCLHMSGLKSEGDTQRGERERESRVCEIM